MTIIKHSDRQNEAESWSWEKQRAQEDEYLHGGHLYVEDTKLIKAIFSKYICASL